MPTTHDDPARIAQRGGRRNPEYVILSQPQKPYLHSANRHGQHLGMRTLPRTAADVPLCAAFGRRVAHGSPLGIFWHYRAHKRLDGSAVHPPQ